MSIALFFLHDISGSMTSENTESARELLNEAIGDISKSLKLFYVPFNNDAAIVEDKECETFLNNTIKVTDYKGLCNIMQALNKSIIKIEEINDDVEKIMIVLITALNWTSHNDWYDFNNWLQKYQNVLSVFVYNYGRRKSSFPIKNAEVLDYENLDEELENFNRTLKLFIRENDNSK